MSPTIEGLLTTLANLIADRVLDRLSNQVYDGKALAPEAPRPDFYSESELAKRTGVSQRTFQGWRAKGGGPRWCKVGRRVLYPRPDAETFFSGGSGSDSPATARHRSTKPRAP